MPYPLKLIGLFLLVLIAGTLLHLILALTTGQLSNATPPGAQGLTLAFLLYATLTALLLFSFTLTYRSLAPTLAATAWLAIDLARLAHIDTRTFLLAGPHTPLWTTLKPTTYLALILLTTFIITIILARLIKQHRLTQHP